MLALRWTLALLAVGCGGGFLSLVVLGNAFRQSFGASPKHVVFLVLPLLALALLITALLAPHWRPVLHAAACAAGGLAVFCVWQIATEAAVVLWFGLAWLAAWFGVYAHTLTNDGAA